MMEDALFSLADDLPDELETAVTSGDQSYNNVGDNEGSVSQLQYSECPQCNKLRQVPYTDVSVCVCVSVCVHIYRGLCRVEKNLNFRQHKENVLKGTKTSNFRQTM